MFTRCSQSVFQVRGCSRRSMHQPLKERGRVAKEQEFKPWFAAGEAENAAPKVSPEELTLCLFLILEIYAALPALMIHGALLFAGAALMRDGQRCTQSIQGCSHTSGDEMGSVWRTHQSQDRRKQWDDGGEDSCWSSSAGHPATVRSGDATRKIGEIKRNLL